MVEEEKPKGEEAKERVEDQKLAEDKRKNYVEEDVQELIPVEDPNQMDEKRNQAGPSPIRPTTPRPMTQKSSLQESAGEPEGKRCKVSVEKNVHSLEPEVPEAKRMKPEDVLHEERRVEATEVEGKLYYHMDNVIEEDFLEWEDDWALEEEESFQDIPDELWSEAPLDRVPPDPPKWVDDLANEVEERRLQRLGVLVRLENLKIGHMKLTTRVVHDWGAKPRSTLPGAPKQFLRRSRMVTREYATDRRDDVHSPASGSHALRLIPTLYLMRRKKAEDSGPQVQLGALDVKDAFLQVPQDEPTQVTTATGHFEVRRNLPGQRIGAKAWFEYFTGWLCEKKVSNSQEPTLAWESVDDVLYLGEKEYVMDYFLPSIKERFEISEQHLSGPGSLFQFLRRTYEETETGLKVHPGKYAENMVEMYEEKMGRATVQSLPCSHEMLEADGTTQLRPDLAGLYRSLVGCGIYLSQERLDVSYVIKELAGSMSCPTTGSLKKLGKLWDS